LVGLGYEVLVASSPSEALRLVDTYEGTISLVLTDVVMPGMRSARRRSVSSGLCLEVCLTDDGPGSSRDGL
jgi:CheY-like chemotaxis protein